MKTQTTANCAAAQNAQIITDLPIGLIANIIKLDEIRTSLEEFQKNVCDYHESTHEQLSIVFKCLMDANGALCNVIGEDIKSLFYDRENTRFLFRKECAA